MTGKSFTGRIGTFFFEQRLRFLLWRHDVKCSYHRFFHCRKAFHRLIPGSTTVKNSDGLYLRTQFLRCIYCDSHFFTNKYNRISYQRIRQRERADFSQAINFIHCAENLRMGKKNRSRMMSGRYKTTTFGEKA